MFQTIWAFGSQRLLVYMLSYYHSTFVMFNMNVHYWDRTYMTENTNSVKHFSHVCLKNTVPNLTLNLGGCRVRLHSLQHITNKIMCSLSVFVSISEKSRSLPMSTRAGYHFRRLGSFQDFNRLLWGWLNNHASLENHKQSDWILL